MPRIERRARGIAPDNARLATTAALVMMVNTQAAQVPWRVLATLRAGLDVVDGHRPFSASRRCTYRLEP